MKIKINKGPRKNSRLLLSTDGAQLRTIGGVTATYLLLRSRRALFHCLYKWAGFLWVCFPSYKECTVFIW